MSKTKTLKFAVRFEDGSDGLNTWVPVDATSKRAASKQVKAGHRGATIRRVIQVRGLASFFRTMVKFGKPTDVACW